MDKMKKKYHLDDPKDVNELIQLIQNGDLSDIEDIGCGEDEEDGDLIDEIPAQKRVRPGVDYISKLDEERLEDQDEKDSDEDMQDPEYHPTQENSEFESEFDNNDEEEDENDQVNEDDERQDENYDEDENNQEATTSSKTSKARKGRKAKKKKRIIQWTHSAFTAPTSAPDDADNNEPLSPLEYFLRYVPAEIFEEMANCINLYALQKGNIFKNTSSDEIHILIALHIIIGCLNKFPRVRMYWEKVLGISLFLDNMGRDRFFQLRTCLHLVNNLDRPSDCTDKLYKVRPILDSVRKRLLELEIEENLSIDEQMIPFTGNMSIKQYIKNKPTPWGIKVFVLCGKSGQAYDFIVYQGQSTGIDADFQKQYGLGSAVILHLCNRIKKGPKLFFDNYFSSYLLFEALTEQKIFAAGTIRTNRFFKAPLISDKIKLNKRGFCDEVVSADGVILTKWLDNKPVNLASNYMGKGAEDTVRRWDKKEKKYVEINRPEVIKYYNSSMGGVDLLDQLISLYRIFIRSKKWTLRVIMHFIDFALANAWIEYKKDAKKAKISSKRTLDLLDFRMRVAESLMYVNKKVKQNKRGEFIYIFFQKNSLSFTAGRPSAENSPRTPTNPKRSRCRGEKRPLLEIQLDATDHMPQFDNNKEAIRCKNVNCKGRSHVFCDKCKVHLCLVKARNCFTSFHRQH